MKGADYHWEECECGRIKNYASHSLGTWSVVIEATEDTEGLRESVCKVCQYKARKTIDKYEHFHDNPDEWSWDEFSHWKECGTCGEKNESSSHAYYASWQVTKEATVNDVGLRERICEICQYVDIEVIPKILHTHNYTGVWISNATTHWHQCSCGAKNSVAFHAYGDWIVLEEATSFADGQKRRTCSVCGHWQTVTIPAN